MAHDNSEDEELEEEEDGTSFRSQKTENPDRDAGSDSASDSDGSLPLRLTHRSLDSGCTSVSFYYRDISMWKVSNASC